MLARRVRFLGSLFYRSLIYPDKSCLYCQNQETVAVGRKFGVMQVRRCPNCGLMFRWPKDSDHTNYSFYQARYTEAEATDMPRETELPELLACNFMGTPQDRGAKIDLLRSIKPPGARVLDFGCSWGYGLHQLTRAGYDAVGFEISQPRAAFGRRTLGARIISSYRDLDQSPIGSFDAIFSYHVLEHLPSLTGIFERFARLLTADGALLVFTPNCGDGTGNLRDGWKPIVGEKHPMAFDTVFFRNALTRYGFRVVALTSPFTVEELHQGVSKHREDGAEVTVYARRD